MCKVRWFVNDKSDKPFYKEAVVGGDRYGTPTSASVKPSLAKVREVEERCASNTAVGDPLEAMDVDEGQEIFFSITAGNDDGFFRINKCSGQLYVAKTGLDYKVRHNTVQHL